MKRCPTCNKTYTDQKLSFCIEDGTPLVNVANGDAPAVAPPRFGDENRSNERSGNDWKPAAYQPPSYVQPGGGGQKKVWPWVLGIVGILLLGVVGLSIAAVLLIPRMVRNSRERNQAGPPVAVAPDTSDPNVNTNANSPPNNKNSATSETGPSNANANSTAPADKELVLAQLKDIENEWTVANINADKKKLARILADDYAGPSGNGQIQGKAEYLRTLQRDPSIQKWDFQNLKVTLRGDRATLTGTLILRRANTDESYTFTDKFVWRDGRWQATGSEVNPLQGTPS